MSAFGRRAFLAGAIMAGMVGGRAARAGQALEIRVEDDDLYARREGNPLMRYRQRPVPDPTGANLLLTTNGYLHPVTAPNGAVVTNHFSPDHPHQRGIFSAWTKTEVTIDGEALHPDFWNIHLGTGRTRSHGVRSEPAGFRAALVSEARRH